MRPMVKCCQPHSAWSPSGLAWVHAQDCPVDPGQKVRDPAEQKARTLHPAGTSTNVNVAPNGALAVWNDHDSICDCMDGCGYVNAHLDDQSDEAYS